MLIKIFDEFNTNISMRMYSLIDYSLKYNNIMNLHAYDYTIVLKYK